MSETGKYIRIKKVKGFWLVIWNGLQWIGGDYQPSYSGLQMKIHKHINFNDSGLFYHSVFLIYIW